MLKAKKTVAIVLSLLMVCSLAACSKSKDNEPVSTEQTAAPTATTAPTEAPEPTPEPFVGIDFEDGNFGFVALDTAPGDAGKAELSVVDFAGSKKLFVDCQDFKVPYLGIDAASILGDKIAEVASMEMEVTAANPDGNFYAISGKIYAYSGADRNKSTDDWSVYVDYKNPNTVAGKLEKDGEKFVADAKNMFIMTKATDNAKDKAEEPTDFYVDNIVFRDANGAAIAVNSAATFDAPEGFGDKDMSNLTPTKNNVNIDGFSVSGDAWAQAGVVAIASEGTFDPALLQPGCILTISYSCSGNVWLVAVPQEGAPFGWTRICQQTAVKNDSNNVCQITYDEIVAALGTEDFSMLYALQAEGDDAWTVSSVTIGYEAEELPALENVTEIPDFNVKADGWAQAGVNTVVGGGTFDASLILPGTVVEISYQSEGPVWLVAVPADGAPYGWTRICQGTAKTNADGNVCQISYDDIVAALGTEDFASTLSILQCEGEAAWEVYSVKIGTPAKGLVKTKDDVAIDGFACKAAGWAQAGVDTTLAGGTFDASLLKPGCVVTISYASAGPVWLVAVPADGAPYGWTRIEQQTAAKNAANNKCQITYDQIVAALGTEDFASTLSVLQCEGEQDWEVYSVSIGYPAE